MGNIVIDTDEEIIGDMKERSEENISNTYKKWQFLLGKLSLLFFTENNSIYFNVI